MDTLENHNLLRNSVVQRCVNYIHVGVLACCSHQTLKNVTQVSIYTF